MPTFTYTGNVTRVYPSLGVVAEPGDTHDFEEAPDGLWESGSGASAKNPAPASAPVRTPEPSAAATADETPKE